MKIKYIRRLKLFTLFCGLALSAASCSYNEVVNANYPAANVYLPAAVNGLYLINNISAPNTPYRYVVDFEKRRFNVPLAVYRSGTNNTGALTINIAADNDTVNNLISQGSLTTTVLLPASAYTVVPSVELNNGKEIASFDLSIDLDYLLTHAGEQTALCLAISNEKMQVNSPFRKAIIVIDPAILRPVPGFYSTVSDDDARSLLFSNTSSYALSYAWDFGDGTTSTDASPLHKYTAAGTYTVKLTATGITGAATVASITETVTVP